jgi:protein SCO1/2
MNNKRNIIPLILLGLAAAFIGFGIYTLNKMPVSPYPEIHGHFSLHSVNGSVSTEAIRGKVGVIYFGYTHCPDVCPDTLLRIGAALKLLKTDEIANVAALFITTDPARDSPALMASYVRHFDSHITGLSGSAAEIETATASFLAGYKKEAADHKGGYTISHVSHITIVRPDGSIGAFMSHGSKPEDIASAIRHWLPWS